MARSSLKSLIRLIDDAKETMEPEQAFLSDLERSIELSDKKNRRKPSQYYKPSSMKCIRNMYFQRIGQEQDESDTSYNFVGICNSGSDIHVRIQMAVCEMKENGMDCEWVSVPEFIKQRGLGYLEVVSNTDTETKLLHKDLNLSFMCDGIIKYKGHYYILELKTETNNKFYYRKDVDPSHHNQAIAYSVAFGIDEVIFVYISRDMLGMKSFMFKVSDYMKTKLVGEIETCDSYVNKLAVPPKPENADKKFCQYCNYKKTCGKYV